MRRAFPAFLIVLLAGCAGGEAPAPAETRSLVDVEEMDVSFLFEEPLTLRVSDDEALLSGELRSIHVQTLPYRETAPAATDGEAPTWALPKDLAKAVLDGRSCAPLRSERAYLPVDTSAPLQCDMVLDPSGRAVVWMVGLGRPYQDAAFLESSLLILEGERYHVFSHVYQVPEADATVQWMAETFPERHPNMSTLLWPNKSFLLHMEEVRGTLSKQIEPPSAEVQDVLAKLRDLAFSVGPSRALTGQ